MNFRSLQKFTFISAGFLAGVIWIAACGGGAGSNISESIADALMAAIDVSYDNTSSGLAATNVQAAIDELKASVDALPAVSSESSDSADSEETKIGHIILSGAAFTPRLGNVPSSMDGLTLVSKDNQILSFHAVLHLPDGAEITELRSYFDNQDMSGGFGSATLGRYRIDTPGLTSGSGLAETMHEQLVFERVDSTISEAIVDNTTYSYFLTITLNDDPNDGLDNIRFHGVKVTYEYE